MIKDGDFVPGTSGKSIGIIATFTFPVLGIPGLCPPDDTGYAIASDAPFFEVRESGTRHVSRGSGEVRNFGADSVGVFSLLTARGTCGLEAIPLFQTNFPLAFMQINLRLLESLTSPIVLQEVPALIAALAALSKEVRNTPTTMNAAPTLLIAKMLRNGFGFVSPRPLELG